MRLVAAGALIGLGFVCLGWYGQSARTADVFQREQNAALDRALNAHRGQQTAVHVPPRRLDARALLGRLEIPSVGLSTVVVEGDDDRTLRIAAGHLPDTTLPWQGGNTAIAGHRDTFFRALKNVKTGDEIRLTTLEGTFRYRVRNVKITWPADVSVLGQTSSSQLTLLTCYPFYYLGSAPKRYVVKAERLN